MKVISVNIGEQRIIQMKNKQVKTGIFKKPVDGAIFLDKELVKGDEVSDRVHHGGVNKAVYGYSRQHYAYWNERYDFVKENFGLFGENITFDDLDETTIHVGNVYQCGDVIIEATEPRQPCYKLGLVFDSQKIVKEFWNTTRSGVYFKVLKTGEVKAGAIFELVKEAPDNPTIAEVYASKKGK